MWVQCTAQIPAVGIGNMGEIVQQPEIFFSVCYPAQLWNTNASLPEALKCTVLSLSEGTAGVRVLCTLGHGNFFLTGWCLYSCSNLKSSNLFFSAEERKGGGKN